MHFSDLEVREEDAAAVRSSDKDLTLKIGKDILNFSKSR